MNKEDYKKLVGNNVKEVRTMLGMTQQELAEKMGLKNKASISRIEHGVEDMTIPRVMAVADALGVNVSVLTGNEQAIDRINNVVDKLHDFEISDSERVLILEYRQADRDTQNMIKRLLAYAGKFGELK